MGKQFSRIWKGGWRWVKYGPSSTAGVTPKSIKNKERQKIESKVPYIKRVLKNHGVEEKPRVEHDNIHKIKGLTYDNVIVNLSNYRSIERDESERLAYTAYSRGRIDCWSIASECYKPTHRESSLGGVQHDRDRIFSVY